MLRLFTFLAGLIWISISLSATEIKKVEPPFWWIGFQNSSLQLLIYGENISRILPEIQYPGVNLVDVIKVENPDYLFLDLEIAATAQPGIMKISFTPHQGKVLNINYELKRRNPGSADRKGFSNSDVLYLLMPDRFSNGDTTNDNVVGMIEKADRSNKNGRHGGDIKGITDHLDYFKNLGVTGIWINPLVENNNPEYSYHGYAITDFYKIDPRYGTNVDYVDLVEECHENKLKVIMDMVLNHCSVYHWFIIDLPMQSWIHQFDDFTKSNFRATTIIDPHASDYDREKMLTGWFDRHMADLNQHNELLKTYLIQNSIWWIEYSGIDGIRVDTQPYSYKDFMSEWAASILTEYPDFNIVGEAWLQKVPFCAYFEKDSPNRDGYNSNIPSVTDFPLYNALSTAFNEEDNWTNGIAKLYYIYAQDYLYGNAMNNLVFADNHDLTRIFSSLKGNYKKWKMAMAALLTTRGIPCIYYGTELLMKGEEHQGHGYIREDFPGGWPTDSISAFTPEGRTSQQKEAFDYLKKLIEWRNKRPVVQNGKFKQFIPDNHTYVYFRYSPNACTMVAFNNSPNEMIALDAKRFGECIGSYTYAVNAVTGQPVYFIDSFTLAPKSVLILDFKK